MAFFIIYDTYQNVRCAANEYFQHQAKQVDSLLNFIDTSIQKGQRLVNQSKLLYHKDRNCEEKSVSMTRFYFLRHGITEINEQRRFNGGRVDSPLTPEGIEQTKKLRPFFANLRFDAIYVSPQFRAQTTLQLAANPQQYVVDERLREFYFGDWEGILFEEVPIQTRQLYRDHPEAFPTADYQMESYEEVFARGKAVVDELARRFPDGHVLIAGHGVHLTLLIQCLLGNGIADFRKDGLLPNASVTIVDVAENQAQLIEWGRIG